MAASDRTVWGVGTSRTLRVHWAMAELGLVYRTKPIRTRTPDTESAEFKALNPRQKIPVLTDGDLTLAESAAIVTYLGETYGKSSGCELVPSQAVARAHYHEWMSFICMELDATSLYVLRRHVDLNGIYGDAPAATDSSRAYFDRMIGAAHQLVGDRLTYLVGDRFTGADIMLTTCLAWAVRYDQSIPAVFESYLASMTDRPAHQAALDANRVP
jgi:glutathione S-transferase